MVKRKYLLILFIIVLSFGLLLTGCSGSSTNTNSYIIEGMVTVNEGNEEDVTLRVDDSSGISTVHPDSNGKWSTVVSEDSVTVTPLYDRNADGQNDYNFVPSNWSGNVKEDKSGINFTGTYSSTSNSMLQKMLGKWEFIYEISSNTYTEYYVFDNLIDAENGQYYAYGYKESEHSSDSGYHDYGPAYPAVATYLEGEETFTVLWILPDSGGDGSYFEFNFDSSTSTEVSGYYYMINNGELYTPDPMTGERTETYSSVLSTQGTQDISIDNKTEELIYQLNQKIEESKEVSITSSADDVSKKIEIKENTFIN